jgi:glycosyltransferase involved in cell wall biosynthesis
VTAVGTFFTIVGQSDYYWRVLAPAKAVNAKPCQIHEDGGWYAISQPNDDTEFRWSMDEEGFPVYHEQEGGTAVWTRPDIARAVHAKAMRHYYGLRVVAETDDNYLSPQQHNIYMRSNGFDEKHCLDHMKAVGSMDASVYSTDWLRDYYWKRLKKQFGDALKGHETFVCRNHVLEQDWPEVEEYDGPVRVGWMGSPSHIWDVDLAWPAMLWAHRAGCKTYMVGYDPTNPEHAVTSEKSREKVRQWEKIKFETTPWKKFEGTRRLALPFDIGLCPLLTNEFTLGKSDIKAVEYTIAGAAVIAQNNSVYNKTWKHGETALLVGSPNEMLEAVKTLVSDPELRSRLVENARQYVREERGEKQLREEWEPVFA